MPATPGFRVRSLLDVAYLVDGQLTVEADSALMASGQLSSITPDHRHPPGTVLGFDSGNSNWVLATDAAVDTSTSPTIVSSGHVDGNGVIAVTGNYGTISVTTATGSGTEAENATDLNADEEFNSHYVATSGAGELTITAIDDGLGEWFYINATTRDAAGFAEGQANEVQGTSADYVVTTGFAELKDDESAAQDFLVGTLFRGHFRTSELSSLTADAQSILLDRGSKFL